MLQHDVQADVAIIGGGITGMTTAMLLGQAGKKVVVIEAMKIGHGTTGNSTGNLYATVDEHLSSIRRKWGADVMKSVVRSREAAIDLMEHAVQDLGIDCDFYRTSFNLLLEHPDEKREDFLKEELEAFLEAGLQAAMNDSTGLPFHVSKAVSVQGQAQFHPLKYIRGLAAKILHNCSVYEHSPVLDFDEDKGIVKTKYGTVKADHVVMATHTPKGVYMVQTVIAPYREQGVAFELNSGTCPQGIFWSLDEPKHSVRSFRNGSQDYVMVVGDKYKTGHAENTLDYVHRLEAYLQSRFDLGAEKYVWGGQQYKPADGLPYIGKRGDKMYIATGFATDGLVYGTLAAMIISDMILEKENAWAETYRFNRFTPLKSFKEFFKEGVDVTTRYFTDGRDKGDEETIENLAPGQAAVFKLNGEKLAVYKDSNGTAHIVSAVCPHQKCTVHWNAAELSWDCPCHGSRFSIEGRVLEGPAISDLPHKKTPQLNKT